MYFETMGWRKTGNFHAPQEIVVMTCDVCECDIGYEDGRRPKAHYQVSRHPNLGAIDDQDPPAFVCSQACLRAFAAKESGPRAVPSPRNGPSSPHGKPDK
jgi:hypothetical protein